MASKKTSNTTSRKSQAAAARGTKTKPQEAAVTKERRAALAKAAAEAKAEALDGYPAWCVLLKFDKNAKVIPSLFNAKVVFTEALEIRGRLAYDSFSEEAVWIEPPPWDSASPPRAVTDNDIREALVWVQRWQLFHHFTKSTVEDAMLAVAHEHAFHPVCDYLKSLKWDGESRLDTFLIDYLGAEDTPLNRAYSAKTFIGAVARVMQPGCMMKTVLTLEARQDFGKSTALRSLMPDSSWFTDHIEEIGSKDSRMQIRGVWLVEFAEFDGLSRADANKAKSFISSPSDKYRPPYGHFVRTFPRQCIFTISINPGAGGYLKDATGNVRYWAVQCAVGWPADSKVDIDAVKAVRDQLWAEAIARYQQGEAWWLAEAALVAAQASVNDERTRLDPWHDKVAAFCETRPAVTMAELLTDCLGIETGRQHRGHEIRVANILTKLGLKRKLFRLQPGKDRIWAYYRAGQDDAGHAAARDWLADKTVKGGSSGRLLRVIEGSGNP